MGAESLPAVRLTQRAAHLPAGNLDLFFSPRTLVQLMPALLRPAQVWLLGYEFIPAWSFSQS